MEDIMLKGSVYDGTYYVTEGNELKYGYIVLPKELPTQIIKNIKKIEVPGGWLFDKYVKEKEGKLCTVINKDSNAIHVLCFSPNGSQTKLFINSTEDDWSVNDIASECITVLKNIRHIFDKLDKKIKEHLRHSV